MSKQGTKRVKAGTLRVGDAIKVEGMTATVTEAMYYNRRVNRYLITVESPEVPVPFGVFLPPSLTVEVP